MRYESICIKDWKARNEPKEFYKTHCSIIILESAPIIMLAPWRYINQSYMFKINSSAYWAFAKLYHYTYVIYVTYHSISKLYVDIMNKYYNNYHRIIRIKYLYTFIVLKIWVRIQVEDCVSRKFKWIYARICVDWTNTASRKNHFWVVLTYLPFKQFGGLNDHSRHNVLEGAK